MSRIKKFLILLVISFVTILSFSKYNVLAKEEYVYLGGNPAGFTLYERGAIVVGLCDVVCGENICSPCKDAEVLIGDIILNINDKEVNCAKDIENSIKNGGDKIVTIKRDGDTIIKNIKPVKDNLGVYKLGVFIKDGISGIGTITYFTEDKVGCLGHAVLDENNQAVNITGGKIYDCFINGVIKGVKGRPGELRGIFAGKENIANIIDNKDCGVYGVLNNKIPSKKKIKVGQPIMGDAEIYTTLYGNTPKKYKISICKYEQGKDSKNLIIKILDKELLETTGGIVQGMSGSPIVQNGKIVGAITHVFVNDPTRGFGISIDNMIIQ